jgi:hypothetical protein
VALEQLYEVTVFRHHRRAFCFRGSKDVRVLGVPKPEVTDSNRFDSEAPPNPIRDCG